MNNTFNEKNVAVKCWFTSTGTPTPLMFKVMDEDDVMTINNVEVMNSKSFKEFSSLIWEFSCRAMVNNRITHFKLRFDSKTCLWKLIENPNC